MVMKLKIGVFILRQYNTHYSYFLLFHNSNEIPSSREERMLQWLSIRSCLLLAPVYSALV